MGREEVGGPAGIVCSSGAERRGGGSLVALRSWGVHRRRRPRVPVERVLLGGAVGCLWKWKALAGLGAPCEGWERSQKSQAVEME